MRKFLFRGLVSGTNTWVYGSLLQRENSCAIVNNAGVIGVDMDSVGEWTGLVDSPGNKIFEGDIIETQAFVNPKNKKEKRFKGVVKYNVKHGDTFFDPVYRTYDRPLDYGAEWTVEFIFLDKDDERYSRCCWGPFYDCVVVGNIHQNKVSFN